MTVRNVTHIVPFFSPTIDGVGDYALNLARNLRSSRNINSRFLIADKNWSGPSEIEYFPAEKLTAAPTETTILHYVGYGYHPRGIPADLLKTILPPRGCLITIFHEIWTEGPPWRSVFYLSWLQKRFVQKILKASVASFTNTETAHRLLRKTQLRPVPANLPIVPRTSPLPSRPEKFLIFGQPDTRLRSVCLHGPKLPQNASVILAGKQSSATSPEANLLARFIPESKIHVAGEITNTQIFSEAGAFLSSHRGADACKSGALMAALASGCPAIFADNSDPSPLRFGKEILTWNDLSHYQSVGAAGREWYYKNADWPIVARRIAEAIP